MERQSAFTRAISEEVPRKDSLVLIATVVVWSGGLVFMKVLEEAAGIPVPTGIMVCWFPFSWIAVYPLLKRTIH